MASQPVHRPLAPDGHAGRLESILHRKGYRRVAGVDEVGRGALAGPLVAAAVLLDVDAIPDGLRDSKVLEPAERSTLAETVHAASIAVSYVVVDACDIDSDGLQVSNVDALAQAVRRLHPRPDYVISDWFELGDVGVPHVGLPKADSLSAAVAAASIVAKVSRDAHMAVLEADHPGYGFSRHKGYSCDEHWAAIRALGPCAEHRRSFRGVGAHQAALDGV